MLTLINPVITAFTASRALQHAEPMPVIRQLAKSIQKHHPGSIIIETPHAVELFSSDIDLICKIVLTTSGQAVQVNSLSANGKNVLAALQKEKQFLRVNSVSVTQNVMGCDTPEITRDTVKSILDYYQASGRPITHRTSIDTYELYRHNFNFFKLKLIITPKGLKLTASTVPPDLGITRRLSQLSPQQIVDSMTDLRKLQGLPDAPCLVPSLKTPVKSGVHPLVNMVKSHHTHFNAIEAKYGDMTSHVLGEALMAICDGIDRGEDDAALQALFIEMTE